jgi:signal transduction histidine kinase
MRSLRRSLTLYLFGLLAITLAVVWVVIDQMTARALAAREGAGADLLRARYEERCREEKAEVDRALFEQAKKLAQVMQMHYGTRRDIEFSHYSRLGAAAPFMFGGTILGNNPLGTSAWLATKYEPGTRSRPNLAPVVMFRMYLANLPLPEEYLQDFEEENRSADYLQINTVSGREWHSKSLAGRPLPFDSREIDGKDRDSKQADAGRPEAANVIDWVYSEGTVGGTRVRKVLFKVPHFTGPRPRGSGGFGGPPGRDDRPRSLVGAWIAWVERGAPGSPPNGFGVSPGMPQTPPVDSLPRFYVQCARPQATIDAALARFAEERDAELAHLSTEIHDARTVLRLQVTVIALAAFLAIAVGGPLLVGRGLRPVGTLSDAVSRVSEKDFKFRCDAADMTVELAPIHARITQTLDLLHRAFSREKQAVADISHELRTPIAALMATIDVALRKPRTPEQYRTTLDECRLIAKQLGQLVERIMTLASLDAGNDHTHVSRVDAADLAAGCASVIRPLAAANGVTVETHLDEPLDLDTDAGKLREVLMNLLHNAIEYNRPDGTIELTARRDNGSVVFEVRDTGIGMTPEVREKIFERFYRADSSRHSTGVHAGLGLAIVREYVNRLGGTIAVESEPGVGSTFRVTLPAPHPAEAADEPITAGA